MVRCDEIGDVYGDGDRGDSPSSYAHLPLPLQLLPPYYFILTAYHSPNTQHHNAYHASHNAFYNAYDNHLSDNAHDNVHNDADKHGLNHAQAATALSPL